MPDLLVPLSALLGVLVGSGISYFSASRDRRLRSEDLQKQLASQRELIERQVLASVRSSNRQAWIDALRSEVAQCLSISNEFLLRLPTAKTANRDLAINDIPVDLQLKLFELSRLVAMIELRLNPNEADHVDLLEHLRKLFANIESGDTSKNYDLQRLVIGRCQRILKAEWNRVRQGE